MAKDFPLVGVIAPHYIYRSLIGPALALGVDLRLLGTEISTIAQKLPGCDLVTVVGVDFPIPTIRTLEAEGVVFRPSSHAFAEISKNYPNSGLHEGVSQLADVLVARSPHAQAAVWAPTEVITRNGVHRLSIAPLNRESDTSRVHLQYEALAIVQKLDLVGVVNLRYREEGEEFVLTDISLGPSLAGNWTMDGSVSNQFEQHLRAILDLPLGDPGMTSKFVASGNFLGGADRNMYRPYLHLMARSPQLKFHQYRDEDAFFGGYVNSTGDNLLDLTETIWHALDYLDGEIDE